MVPSRGSADEVHGNRVARWQRDPTPVDLDRHEEAYGSAIERRLALVVVCG